MRPSERMSFILPQVSWLNCKTLILCIAFYLCQVQGKFFVRISSRLVVVLDLFEVAEVTLFPLVSRGVASFTVSSPTQLYWEGTNELILRRLAIVI